MLETPKALSATEEKIEEMIFPLTYAVNRGIMRLQGENEMDNQQVTPERLAYMAGIWDGEGTFTVNKSFDHRKKVEHQYNFTASSIVGNSNADIIYEVVKFLDDLNISFHITYRDGNERNKNWSGLFYLTIRKLSHNKKFIELLLPYLIGKKSHAEILLRFINRRLELFYTRRVSVQDGRSMDDVYNDTDEAIYKQIKSLNARGVKGGTSETKHSESELVLFSRIVSKYNISLEQFNDLMNGIREKKIQSSD